MTFQRILLPLLISSALFFVGCGEKPKTEPAVEANAQAGLPPELARGEELYTQNCASCHGEQGAGDGPAAQALNPKPRNYKAPANEWKNGNSVAGISKTLKEGIKGTSMVSYAHLGPEGVEAVAKYVEYLSKN